MAEGGGGNFERECLETCRSCNKNKIFILQTSQWIHILLFVKAVIIFTNTVAKVLIIFLNRFNSSRDCSVERAQTLSKSALMNMILQMPNIARKTGNASIN